MTYETYDDAIKAIEQLRETFAKSDFHCGQPPMSHEFFKLALSHLQESEQFLTLAHYNYMQGR